MRTTRTSRIEGWEFALADRYLSVATDSLSACVFSSSIYIYRLVSLTVALYFSSPFSVFSKSSWQHFRGYPAIKPQMPKSIIRRTIAFGTEFNEVVGEYGQCAICGKIFRINQTPRCACDSSVASLRTEKFIVKKLLFTNNN